LWNLFGSFTAPFNCVTGTQAADDEIEIFVPGASKRQSVGATNITSDVSVSSLESPPGNDTTVLMPNSNELHDQSLNSSITPKAPSSSGDDDICSTTLVDEPTSTSVSGDDVPDVQPLAQTSDKGQDGSVDDAEQLFDVDGDKFFCASEGESLPLLFTSVYFPGCYA